MLAQPENPPTNAVSEPMARELIQVLHEVNTDPQTKVVVLTGAGEKAFCAGGDLGEIERLTSDPVATINSFLGARRLLQAYLGLEKPMIARVNGHAIGLGATLALFCDLAYAVEGVRIADPHVAVGYAAGDGGALIWPQMIGYMRDHRVDDGLEYVATWNAAMLQSADLRVAMTAHMTKNTPQFLD